jgi:hypothetical protein
VPRLTWYNIPKQTNSIGVNILATIYDSMKWTQQLGAFNNAMQFSRPIWLDEIMGITRNIDFPNSIYPNKLGSAEEVKKLIIARKTQGNMI